MYVHQIKNEKKVIRFIKENGCLFVSRYKDSHYSARKLAKRMHSDGILSLKEVSGGFIYRITEVVK